MDADILKDMLNRFFPEKGRRQRLVFDDKYITFFFLMTSTHRLIPK
jgi:hypothetical protein